MLTIEAEPLGALLQALEERDYEFVTPTNATYRIVTARVEMRRAVTLRDILGWSRPFRPGSVDPEVESLLDAAGVLVDADEGCRRSLIRVARVGGHLFIHSAYPAKQRDAVFLGPDTYRFAAYINRQLASDGSCGSLVDVGAGAGVGGITAARTATPDRVYLTDVNPVALELAAVNARHAGVPVELQRAEGLTNIRDGVDLIVANPPFIAGRTGRTYSEGGDMLGARLSYDWAVAAMGKLSPGGRLLLYSGSAIVEGRDVLRLALEQAARARGCDLAYEELDPDIFGGELRKPAYAKVERIAAIGAVVARRA